MTVPEQRLHDEIAYLAYHFHWALEDILDLEHADRARYVAAISALNSER
ncbi:hypothetical protein EDD27_1331 [Nonomuraea polychroma]|uniref:DUF6760 domain-containing protein n=1 Tax=Nonomuraea polychroma TaxID=46176 RepID=A0A438LZM8_9ACTN|nr:DUF6760 family protein [Nonomuraea polychroma]RVX38999.1 hypothetical protein EDD27_1331 [Nonomuraea polychroma]